MYIFLRSPRIRVLKVYFPFANVKNNNNIWLALFNGQCQPAATNVNTSQGRCSQMVPFDSGVCSRMIFFPTQKSVQKKWKVFSGAFGARITHSAHIESTTSEFVHSSPL